MTDNQSEMVFLNRLPEPIHLQNGEKKTSILYFGIAQDMEQLNPYFNCEAITETTVCMYWMIMDLNCSTAIRWN